MSNEKEAGCVPSWEEGKANRVCPVSTLKEYVASMTAEAREKEPDKAVDLLERTDWIIYWKKDPKKCGGLAQSGRLIVNIIKAWGRISREQLALEFVYWRPWGPLVTSPMGAARGRIDQILPGLIEQRSIEVIDEVVDLAPGCDAILMQEEEDMLKVIKGLRLGRVVKTGTQLGGGIVAGVEAECHNSI